LRDLLLPQSVFLIEWPERGGAAIPDADLVVRIRYAAGDLGREVTLSGGSIPGQSVLQVLSAPAKS
jgi:tRNA threonylcarbamoyladenosine biosynthesis protein TsaE